MSVFYSNPRPENWMDRIVYGPSQQAGKTLRARQEAERLAAFGYRIESVAGFTIIADPTMSKDRIDFVQDGKVVGRIDNVDWSSHR
jgi:hypothetical protein